MKHFNRQTQLLQRSFFFALLAVGLFLALPALTFASRVLSFPEASLTNLRRSWGWRRKAESKISLSFCHFSPATSFNPKSKVLRHFETVIEF